MQKMEQLQFKIFICIFEEMYLCKKRFYVNKIDLEKSANSSKKQ